MAAEPDLAEAEQGAHPAAEGTPEEAPGTPPLPSPRTPSPPSSEGLADEDWEPGARPDKKRGRGRPAAAGPSVLPGHGSSGAAAVPAPAAAAVSAPAAAHVASASASATPLSVGASKKARRGKVVEEAPLPLPSLLAVANVPLKPQVVLRQAPPNAASTRQPSREVASQKPPQAVAVDIKRASPEDTVPLDMVGVWYYAANLSYEINSIHGKLVFREFHSRGNLFCQGELHRDGLYWMTTLQDAQHNIIGKMRLLYQAALQRIISNHQDLGSKEWKPDTAATKKAPAWIGQPQHVISDVEEATLGPVLLEGILGLVHSSEAGAGCRNTVVRHFVLYASRLDCYENLEAKRAGHSRHMESFHTALLLEDKLTDGCVRSSIDGQAIKLFFVEPSVAKTLPAAIKKADARHDAHTGGRGSASAEKVPKASSAVKAPKATKEPRQQVSAEEAEWNQSIRNARVKAATSKAAITTRASASLPPPASKANKRKFQDRKQVSTPKSRTAIASRPARALKKVSKKG